MTTHDWLDRAALARYSVEPRQFIDFREATLPDGQRVIDAYNGSGLTYTVLPDRGLDVWAAHYNGRPLTWLSQNSPHLPDFGLPWLQQFNGGLVVTCGLTHVGPPETDPGTGVFRDLHGQYSRLRAAEVRVERDDPHALALTGTVAETKLFGVQLRLERRYTLRLGEPAIHIADGITNRGDQPAPLMVLYHVNPGYPLVAEGARFDTPHAAVYPRDAEARKGYATWPNYAAPVPRYAEQVFFHHLKQMDGQTCALLGRDDFGLLWEWDPAQMPYLTQWKNTRTGIYVCGVEPGNCIPEGQSGARASGRLQTIEPGETRAFDLTLRVLPDADAVAAARERIAALRATGETVPGVHLADFTL